MKFTPDEQVIDLLIGQLLYSSPDAAMRELLQNAEDACSLQALESPSYVPTITVRFSVAGNWVEVIDNGLGMNEEAIERSFASIGAPKNNVSHIRELLNRAGGAAGASQIGRFGVGVLSCFGVSQTVSVWTKMENQPALAFEIPALHAEFQSRSDVPTERGTRIRLQLKAGSPMSAAHVEGAVMRYVRHAKHIKLEEVDSGRVQEVEQPWNGASYPGAVSVQDEDVEGVVALSPAWDAGQAIPQADLVMCNGGFLVKDRELALLPREAVGYTGELNARPGRLALQLNRESFVQDERWQAVGVRMRAFYTQLVAAKTVEWERAILESPEAPHPTIEPALMVLARGPARGLFDSELLERIDRMLAAVIRFQIRGTAETTTLANVITQGRVRGVIYFTREGEAPRQFQQSLSHEATNIQVTEVAQTEAVRVAHLRAKGEIVLSCRQRQYSCFVAEAQQTIQVHDVDLLAGEVQKASIRLVNVNDASPAEVALAGVPEGELIGELLGMGEQLKFVSLDEHQGRVIRDFAGKLLNLRHPEVREVLRVLPDVVGNPVRRALLQIYLDLETYNLTRARMQIKELLTMQDLHERAQLQTGELLRQFLADELGPLFATSDAPHD